MTIQTAMNSPFASPAADPLHRQIGRMLVLVFTASLSAPPVSAMAAGDRNTRSPQDVVFELIDAMAVNDAERIRAVFAEDARQAYGQGQPKSGDAFRAWLETDIVDVYGRVDDAAFYGEGNSVVVTGQYQNNNGYSNAANFLLIVENGQIVSWQMRY